MDKHKYYVSVQSNSIVREQGATPYEFEIYATQQEVDELQHLLEMKMNSDDRTYFRAHLPAYPYHVDPENDAYDHYLQQVYKQIYQCGTEETKQAMQEMRILSQLQDIGDT